MTVNTTAYFRGVRDGKLAPWVSENSYGTTVDIGGIRDFTITVNYTTDQLKGDDRVLDRFSRIESVTVDWEQAEVNLAVINALMGGSYASNADYERVVMGEVDTPYVALAGKTVASDGSETHFFVPKAKMVSGLKFMAKLDTYVIPGAQFEGVYEGTINQIFAFNHYRAATLLTIPLKTTVGLT